MRNQVVLSFLVSFVLFLSCSESKEEHKFLSINGEKIELSKGIINNLTLATDDYGTFNVELGDSLTKSSNYFSFRLYSKSKTIIEDGTYMYKFWPDTYNHCSFLKINTHNSTNLNEKNASWSGVIYVNISDGNTTFEFDLFAEELNSENVFTIGGGFDGEMSFVE